MRLAALRTSSIVTVGCSVTKREYPSDRGEPAEIEHNQHVDRTISATVDAAPERTMAALADLSTYPTWLTLVTAAAPDGDDAWLVTLRARLGPLARSKRLRMVRTELTEQSVRFERSETDDRDHSEWILTAGLEPGADTKTDVKVHLHYGGALWTAPLEIVLSSFEGSAADRLTAYLTDTTS